MLKKVLMASAGAALFAAAPASAAGFVSTFENLPNGPAAGTYVIVNSADGWTGNPDIELQNNVAGSPATPPVGNGGKVFVELDTTGNSSMFRDITAGTYTLSYLYSPRPNVGFDSNGIQVFLGANVMPISQISGIGGSNTSWSQINIGRFTVSGTQRLTFAANGNSDSLGGYLDNITLTAVPEPSTWALFILGFGAIGATLRRRNGKAVATKASLNLA